MLRGIWVGMSVIVALGVGLPPLRALEPTLDLAYGPDPRQRLDLYLPDPADRKDRKRPAVFWIHGGGWREGDKRTEPHGISVLAPLLVEKGFVAVSCNYRFAPAHRYPAQVDDVQRAVRWVRAHAGDYGIDPDRVGAVGISAGGHLVSILGVRDTRAKAGDGLDRYSSRIQAVVNLNGPTDLRGGAGLDTPILTQAVTGLVGEGIPHAAQLREEASPLHWVSRQSAPTLFVVGTRDTLVPNTHAHRMAEAMKREGADAEVLVLEGAGHAIFPSVTPRAKEAAVDFFVRKLKP